MPKSDDKGEPVQTVRIGGREIEVPVIFILPEEAGEKEIERYEHPKVHIKKEDKAAESKEEPLEELTDGKLEEIEKPNTRGGGLEEIFNDYSDEEIVEEDGKITTRKKKPKKKKEPLLSNSWEAMRDEWFPERKSLGALGWGKLNRDGTKKKLRKRQPKLDDFSDDNGDKKDES